MRGALALLLCASVPALAHPAPMRGPVAVMPFKNLNRNPKLDWLSVGMAETMLSDLKHGGRFRIVERDQVDHALAQMALDGTLSVAPSTAAKLGKIVGAKTIVLGAYQKYGQRIRITARFVQVETGLVLDTAKVTGKMTRIFSLQDRIVGHLLGRAAPPRAKHIARPSGPRSVKAYRLYSLALTTTSQARRVSYLKQAVKIDPTFTYALDDLRRLREALGALHQKSEQVYASKEDQLRAKAKSAFDPTSAQALLSTEITAGHYGRLATDAHRVYAATAGRPSAGDLHELAAYYEFTADTQLSRRNLALQLGKRFLSEFPGGRYNRAVEVQMQVLVNAREDQLHGKDQLAKLDLARAKKQADLERERRALSQRRGTGLGQQSKALEMRSLQLEEQGCVDAYRAKQWEVAIRRCRAFLDHHRAQTAPDPLRSVPTVRWYLVLAYKEAGQFAAARKAVKPLLEDPSYGTSARFLANSLPNPSPPSAP